MNNIKIKKVILLFYCMNISLFWSQESIDNCVKDSANVYFYVEEDSKFKGSNFQKFVYLCIEGEEYDELITLLKIKMIITTDGKAQVLSINEKTNQLNLKKYESNLWVKIEETTNWIPAKCSGKFVNSYKFVYMHISFL